VPENELASASSIVAFARFRDEALDEHADVVFPAPVYAEKEGTVTHPDGRLQRVRQAIGHPGEARPAWWVLAELCERAGAGLGALSSTSVTAALAEAVPFYAGITLEELGGSGVRWQDRDAASALAAVDRSAQPLATPPSAAEGLRVATATSFWSGPEIDHSPTLRFLATGPVAELSVEDARAAGVANGDELRLAAGDRAVTATAVVRTGVPSGSVFVSGASLPEGGPVELETAVAAR
jgi:NADH-quinone oxidoreductase subunit G